MRRGTTPTYTAIADKDLTGYTCYLAIKGVGGRIDLEGDRLDITCTPAEGEDDEGSTEITFKLTQRETLRLKPGKAEVQLRAAIGPDPADAVASDLDYIEVGKILRDGEIHA